MPFTESAQINMYYKIALYVRYMGVLEQSPLLTFRCIEWMLRLEIQHFSHEVGYVNVRFVIQFQIGLFLVVLEKRLGKDGSGADNYL